MNNTIICFTERCSSWGKQWKRHWFNKETDDCYRCGMSREEAKNQ